MPNEDAVDRATARYPPPDITPAEFEEYVADLLMSSGSNVEGLVVTLHDKIEAADGTYDFDATMRYELAGMTFVVIVEAKRHKNPIKRELIQTLRQKVLSVGAHKGIMVSTAPYQSGALEFAKIHGIALVTVTEGRFTFETKSLDAPPRMTMTRAQARERFGFPTFVGHLHQPGEMPGSTSVLLLSPQHPEYLAKLLEDQPPEPP